MNFLFLINSFFCFALVYLFSFGFFRFRKNKFLSKIVYNLSVMGIFYLLIGLSSLLWFFRILEFSSNDFLVLYSMTIVIQSILFFRIITLISRNNKLYFFLFFYLIAIVFSFYSGMLFFNLLIIISFLLCFLFFIDLTFRKDLYKRIGYIGMLYSLLGALFQFSQFFESDHLFGLSIFLEGFLFLLIYLFLRDLKINPPVSEYKINLKERHYFLNALGHIIFIVILTNLVLVGTIALHEFGHFSIAKLYGCQAERIVYEGGYFHTEVLCKDDSNNIFVFLGGILIPFLVAIILFFTGGRFVRDISILIAGFNLLSISKDFSQLGISNNFIFASVFFGVLLFLIGITILARSKVEEDIYLFPMINK